MAGFEPKTEREIIEILTGIFEGGTYCTLADNPADTQGGLSYGRHQAAEFQGSLVTMLKLYVNRALPPLPDPALKLQMLDHLGLYDSAGKKYQGTAEQRTDYKRLLRKACNDPAMHAAQDEFFDTCYFVPAMQHVSDFGITRSVGRSIFYDIAIQAGAQRTSFYRSAIARWMKEQNCTCTACKPKDPNGPDEVTFLRFVNAARRTEMLGSSSPAYRLTVYRPNEYDKLLDAGNLDFKQDFVFKGVAVKALP